MEARFDLGVIEGFYGRPWGDADRLAMLAFLARCGYTRYVYAPKADGVLRRCWRERWDAAGERRLQAIAERARRAGIGWGVGLSPLGLVEDRGTAGLRAFRDKLAYLDQFGPDVLCVLFDDMPGGLPDLAARQAEVVAEARAVCRARELLVCPSYYSRDPALERLFGAMPSRYWERLGELLPAETGIFWTGEKVCSTGYGAGELTDIARRFRRPPVLWDNYPVNDGARASNFLHLDAFRGRPPVLRELVAAHYVNPMNQCWLSRVPLATLPLLYRRGADYAPDDAFRESAAQLAGASGAALLEADLEALQRRGRAVLAEHEREALIARYAPIAAPWARELVAWLRGDWTFDPACLTD